MAKAVPDACPEASSIKITFELTFLCSCIDVLFADIIPGYNPLIKGASGSTKACDVEI